MRLGGGASCYDYVSQYGRANLKAVVLSVILVISGCASQQKNSSSFDSLVIGSWRQCGTAEYRGRVTGSGSTTTFYADNTYRVSVSDVYDDLSCSNKIDGVGVTVQGEYQIIGKSSLGDDIYEINFSNWSNSGWPCFTIVQVNDEGMLFGKNTWSPKLDCKVLQRRHQVLQDKKFRKVKI